MSHEEAKDSLEKEVKLASLAKFCENHKLPLHYLSRYNISMEAVEYLKYLYELYDRYGKKNIDFKGFYVNSDGVQELNFEVLNNARPYRTVKTRNGMNVSIEEDAEWGNINEVKFNDQKHDSPVESHRLDILDVSKPNHQDITRQKETNSRSINIDIEDNDEYFK